MWAAVVAERLGHPADTALTLGRAVAGSVARIKARNIGREERKSDRDADTAKLRSDHVTAPVFLLGKTIRLLPTTDGELARRMVSSPLIPWRFSGTWQKRSATIWMRSSKRWTNWPTAMGRPS